MWQFQDSNLNDVYPCDRFSKRSMVQINSPTSKPILRLNPNRTNNQISKDMENLTLAEIENKVYETILADKKYMHYTRITLVLLTQIGKPNTYAVKRKLQTMLTTANIDEAIAKYNTYQ